MRSLLVIALLAGPAAAEKFTHAPPAPVGVTLTDRVKPPPRHDAPAAPSVGADEYLKIEELLGDVHEDQIAILKGLAATATDPAERADTLFRLAEMYAKQYRLHHLRAVEAQLAHKDPAPQTDAATRAMVLTVKTYKALTDDDTLRTYPKMDAALFYYAYTLQLGGYKTPSRQAFAKLLEAYPKSKFVPEAHLAFGEAAFEAGQLAEAETRYRQVIKFHTSSIYGYALYKLGWVQLNQSKPQEALETFYQVAQLAHADPKSQLFRAAKHDFVRAYAEVGRADKAYPAFKRVDGASAFDMLAALGDLYLGQGKADKAIYVYREMLRERPASPLACAWEYNVARAMLTVGAPADRVHEIEELVRLYSAVAAKLPKADAAECRDAAAEMSGQLARMYHQEAVKTKSVELAGFADRLYKAYLGAFPDAKDFGDTQYFHAELRWARAEMEPTATRWEDAARAFTEVAQGKRVDAKLAQVSAHAAMLGWMKALAVDTHVREVPVTDADYDHKATPRPIPEREQRLLGAYDGYLALVTDPKDSERVDVQFHKANLLRRYDHFAEAIPLYVDILTHHRDHEAAEYAAQLLLDSYNRLQQYDQLLALADKLAADPWTKQHEALAGTVAKVHRQGVRKRAQALEEEGRQTHVLAKFVACANTYIAAYNEQIDASDADELLYSAGVCFEEGKSMGAAKLVYENLAKLFPKSKLTARSIARLGNVYAQTAFFREASEKLEEYAAKYAGEKDAYDALSDAVGFRKGIGDDAQAIADTQAFVRKFGAQKPAEAATAFWSLGAIYEKQGDLDAQIRHHRAYLATYRASDATREVRAYAELGQALWQKACPVKTVDGSCVKVQRELSLRIAHHRADATHCGDATKVVVTVVPRDESTVRAAMAAFTSAIAASHGGQAPRTGGAEQSEAARRSIDRGELYYTALAKLGLAERDYERYLALPLPTGLDFTAARAAQSRKRFDTWLLSKRDVALGLKHAYEAVVKLGDGATAIAAASRLGQVYESFSGQLFRAEIPANLRTGPYAEEASQNYCDAVTEAAEPLETEAKTAYQLCLQTSTRLGWFSEASRVCERELGQLDPNQWPTASELRPAPEQISRIAAIESAPDELR